MTTSGCVRRRLPTSRSTSRPRTPTPKRSCWPTKGLQETLYKEMLGRIKQTDLSVPSAHRRVFLLLANRRGPAVSLHVPAAGQHGRPPMPSAVPRSSAVIRAAFATSSPRTSASTLSASCSRRRSSTGGRSGTCSPRVTAAWRRTSRSRRPSSTCLVALALNEGAFAARLTGAGFGGSVVALVDVDQATAVGARVVERYRAESGLPGAVHLCEAVAGALPPVIPTQPVVAPQLPRE